MSDKIRINEQSSQEPANEEYVTLDINGHTFYVDFGLKKLRPKGDGESQGIPFEVFKSHFDPKTNRCEIPYNKRKHEFIQIDYDKITEIPEDVVVVGFPNLDILNPVEYSVMGGCSREDFQDEEPRQKHFTATILKGNSDWLEFLVKVNQTKENLPALKSIGKSRTMGR